MNQEEQKIIDRLFNVIPVGTLQMQEFLRILSINFSTTQTQSAAITCDIRPTLLINPDFIKTYCKTDEHLFMLIIHELYHIILGHTALFKKGNIIDNIAFDAIINSILCKTFPQEEYTSFFTQLNCSNKIPSCLLRPPAKDNPQEAIEVLNTLYNTDTGTYFEVYKILIEKYEKDIKQFEQLLNKIPEQNSNTHNTNSQNQNNEIGEFILIGNHNQSESITKNPILKEMVEQLISKWPRVYKIKGRDMGGNVGNININYESPQEKLKRKMKNFLKIAGIKTGDSLKTKLSIKLRNQSAVTLIPNYFDRTITAKKILMNNVLLYNQTLSNNQPINETPLKVFVYLDVSGSVQEYLQKFAPLLIKPYKEKKCLMFCFSTKVTETNPKDFIKGNFNSTCGTDINCVFKHFFNLPKKKRAKKIIILTDGYTGEVNNKYKSLIQEKNIKVYCGLFGEEPQKEDLKNIVKKFEEFKL